MFSGSDLKRIREGKGLSQEDFAKLVGVSRSAVYAWESGKYAPADAKVKIIAQELGVMESAFMGDDQYKQEPQRRVVELQKNGSIIFIENEELRSNARNDPSMELSEIQVISPRTPACCGNGNGLEGVELELGTPIMIPTQAISAFGIDRRKLIGIPVEGRSMEPDFFDGDIAVFSRGESVRHGDIGVVEWRGRWYVRGILYFPEEKTILRAINKDFKDIEIEWDDPNLDIKGKVLIINPKPRKCMGIL